MKPYEKLDFLMNITKTSNSTLSMRISLDASHISRLRRGERKLVREAEYLRQMSDFFVHQCTKDYQKNALIERMNKPTTLFDDLNAAGEQVYLWLTTEEKSENDPIAGFLNGLHGFRKTNTSNDPKQLSPFIIPTPKTDIALFHGIDGKREAVLKFLSIVSESNSPGTLLLYSDESMDWLTQDPVFQIKWMNLLQIVLSKGNRIRIIHTVSRNLDEMLEALSKWIPLYMTGFIEPFYYPKIRDGIFRRTMFIAPQRAAVASNSIGEMDDKVTNFLFQKADVIESLEKEFNNYLTLCKPLMHIFTDKNLSEYLKILEVFEMEKENAILQTDCLSMLTMPDQVAYSMLARTIYKDKKEIKNLFLARNKNFLAALDKKSFIEIIKLGDIEKIKAGLLPVSCAGMEGFSDLCYHPEEYRDHIVNIIHLLNTYDNFHVVIDRESERNGYWLYAKEDLGVIIEKTNKPHVIFAINEKNMTAAFWNHLSIISHEKKMARQKVINELTGLLELL